MATSDVSFKWADDVEVESANLDIFLKDEFIEMTFDLKSKSVHTFKGISYYWIKEKFVAKYPNFCANVEPILLAFPGLYTADLSLAVWIIY